MFNITFCTEKRIMPCIIRYSALAQAHAQEKPMESELHVSRCIAVPSSFTARCAGVEDAVVVLANGSSFLHVLGPEIRVRTRGRNATEAC